MSYYPSVKGRQDAKDGKPMNDTDSGSGREAHPESDWAHGYRRGYEDELRIQELERQSRKNWLWICALTGACFALAVMP